MFEQVIQSIRSYASLSDEDVDQFTNRLLSKTIPKGDSLLEIGQVCNSWSFVSSGSFREYYFDGEMNEVITNLFTENNWVLNQQSFTGRKPSQCKVEAFEDSEILEINIHDLHDLIGQSPAFFALGKILEADKKFDQSATPEEKYLKLLSSSPEILKKFPLKYIASYLGMTPETLSRVRARI